MFLPLIELQRADNVFVAPEAPDKGDATFGGQLIAQSLAAAYQTLDDDRAVHSLHAYFLRPGDVDQTTELEVTSIRDGRSFSSREVHARQSGKEVFRLIASFQVDEESPVYDRAIMPEVPPPEAVATTYDDFTLSVTHPDGSETWWYGADRPMEIRYINPPTELSPVTEPQLMWMRVAQTLPDDAATHAIGLAYLSDSTLVDHILLPHGGRWQEEDFLGTSIDHSMWFRRPARADEWLLFEQTVETTGTGRGLANGRFFDSDGKLIATCMQEGLMRWITT